MKQSLKIINALALAVTIVVNYLSNTGFFNGKTIADVSDKYVNYFTPAGFTFAIWGLIYLGLIAFIIYTFTKYAKDHVVTRTGWWFIISCIANCSWIVAWLYDYTGLSVFILLIQMICLLAIIVKNYIGTRNASLSERCFVWIPFSLYSGWLTVALIADIAAYLTKINWKGFGIPEATWCMLMIFVAGALHIYVAWKRRLYWFSLVSVWALIGIAAANEDVSNIKNTALTVAIIVFIVILVVLFSKKKPQHHYHYQV